MSVKRHILDNAVHGNAMEGPTPGVRSSHGGGDGGGRRFGRGGRRISWNNATVGLAVVAGVEQRRPNRPGVVAPFRSAAQAHRGSGGIAAVVAGPQPLRIRLSDRTVDGSTAGVGAAAGKGHLHETPVSERLARSARHHPTTAPAGTTRTRRCKSRRLGGGAMAADQKKVRRRHATLGFTDDSGFLLMPLVCRTLARRGQTPRLVHRARHRDKVSVAAALTVSPSRGHIGLHYQTFPNGYVTAEIYAQFVRRSVLRQQRGP